MMMWIGKANYFQIAKQGGKKKNGERGSAAFAKGRHVARIAILAVKKVVGEKIFTFAFVLVRLQVL